MPIIFNDQYYGTLDFNTHKREEYRKTRRLVDSGSDSRLLDPRTGENNPFNIAIKTLYHRTVSILHLS